MLSIFLSCHDGEWAVTLWQSVLSSAWQGALGTKRCGRKYLIDTLKRIVISPAYKTSKVGARGVPAQPGPLLHWLGCWCCLWSQCPPCSGMESARLHKWCGMIACKFQHFLMMIDSPILFGSIPWRQSVSLQVLEFLSYVFQKQSLHNQTSLLYKLSIWYKSICNRVIISPCIAPCPCFQVEYSSACVMITRIPNAKQCNTLCI